MKKLLYLVIVILLGYGDSCLFGMMPLPEKEELPEKQKKSVVGRHEGQRKHKRGSAGSAKTVVSAASDGLDGSGSPTPSYFYLINAVNNGKEGLVVHLLQQDDKIRIDGAVERGETALRFACLNGNKNIAKLLLHTGANPNIKTNSGKTCLHDVCEQSSVSFPIVELLLKHNKDTEKYKGTDPNLRDNDRNTPLLVVAARKEVALLNLMLKYKIVNRNKKNKYNQTFFYVAYACDTFKKLEDLVFFKHFTKHEKHEFLQKQLHKAVMHLKGSGFDDKFLGFIDLCVDGGADLCKKNNKGLTPLEKAYEEYMFVKGKEDKSKEDKEHSTLRFRENMFYAFLLRTPLTSASPWFRLRAIIDYIMHFECEKVLERFLDGDGKERAKIIEKVGKEVDKGSFPTS